MPFNSIIMPYKQNCKAEGEVITKFKIAKLYFQERKKQKEIANHIQCHYNTVNNIIRKCKLAWSEEIAKYLLGQEKLPLDKLELFSFLQSASRRPKSNRRSLVGAQEKLILAKHRQLNYGPGRMFKHLKRQGYDTEFTYTLAKIKGVYRRNGLKTKKIRTVNGNRRPLYNYHQIGAFEYLQYDTKEILDQKSLPQEIYQKFRYSSDLPKYQWTIVDAKTRTRFLAWSHTLNSTFGLWFLEFVICWLRAHQIRAKIRIQIDGGSEFCSGSEKKQQSWNDKLAKYNAEVYLTEGAKWKQNLVERTHRTDDEEFYCPRGEFIQTKADFLVEAQHWIIYHNNHRPSEGIGLNGLSPKEKLDHLGFYNAEDICNFPCLFLEDYFQPFQVIFDVQKSQNVLTYYPKALHH